MLVVVELLDVLLVVVKLVLVVVIVICETVVSLMEDATNCKAARACVVAADVETAALETSCENMIVTFSKLLL